MGCTSSKADPNKKKYQNAKSLVDLDQVMGNIIPSQYVIEQNNKNGVEEQQEDQGNINNFTAKARKEIKLRNKIIDNKNDGEIFEKITKIEKKLQSNELKLIVKCLKDHFVFYALQDNDLQYIIKKMFYCEVQDQQFLFKQGEKASLYFIINKGTVEIFVGNQSKKQLTSGSSIGELALLYNAPRSASVKCIGDCGFWAIDRNTFRKTIEEIASKDLPINKEFMKNVNFFNIMTSDQQDSIACGILTQKFAAGQNIVNEGDQADSFYMIKEGSVSIIRNNKEVRKLGPKDSFGENALYQDSVRMASVKTDTEVIVLSLSRDLITNILGDKVQIIIYNNTQRWAFDKSNLLKQLTKIQTEKLIMNSSIQNFKANDVIFDKNKNVNKIAIVLEGGLIYQSTKQTASDKASVFGEDFLLKDRKEQKVSDNIIMRGDGVLAILTFAQVEKLIGKDIEQVIKNNSKGHEVAMAALDKKKDYSHILLQNLIHIRKLGSGQFGNVYLVQDKLTKQLYALKEVSKGQITEQNLETHIVQEKQILQIINFPFIMNFFRSFKDQYSIYLLTQFINGMELFDAIRIIGILTPVQCQFYIGTMLLALEYLHSQQIIYRDLKPENIMVDSNGIMYVIDLGTGKILNKNVQHGKTFTMIGTPHYMAPEIFGQKGYGFSCDLWSVGICLYEFVNGDVPYGENCEDPQDIYMEIMKKKLTFQPNVKDRLLKKICEQLLSRQPEQRLGGSYAAIKAQPWFDNFDWDKLYNQELKPPFKPPQNKICKEEQIQSEAQKNKPLVDILTKENEKHKQYKDLDIQNNWDAIF